jgi:N-acetylmuramoyl-L-alanine amidase|tara:strand:- start:96 stop:713 length:618 start_codon:yes stop_codon:yes gene_type:complete
MSQYTWLLDPGHGGIIDGKYQTAGKRSPLFPDGSVLYEGVFNRDVVGRIIKLCQDNNIDCINLVDTEEDVSLRHRVTKANLFHKENRNSIYVSVHANAFGKGREFNRAKGVNTFHHFRSSKGKRLAEVLQRWLADLTPLRDRGVRSNDTWANFYVLRKTNMPAVLSENGFMTNFDDATALMDPDVRQAVANAHFAMIQEIEENGL